MDPISVLAMVQTQAKRDVITQPELMKLARDLEASFLSVMLSSAGLGDARTSLGGGAGEDQFSGFLVQEYAGAMARAGGIGLSEAIYRSLVQGQEAGQ